MGKTAVIIGFDAELYDIGDNLQDQFHLVKADVVRSVDELPSDDQRNLYIVDDNYCTLSDKNTAWQSHVHAIRNRYPEAKILLFSVFSDDAPLAKKMNIAFHECGTEYEHFEAVIQELLQ